MKVACPLCEKKVPRKRLVPIQGLKLGGRIARVCEECVSKPDEEHRKDFERECEEWEKKELSQ